MATALNQLLEQLGLTEYESKTLSTLFVLAEAEAPEVSRIAQVPKTRVYDVLDKLVKKNLVIEIRGRPKKYRVVDAQQALDSLVSKKKEELASLEQTVEGAKQTIQQGGAAGKRDETVMKVKDPHDFERILGQEIEGATESILGFTELTGKRQIVHAAMEKAHSKKVNIRLLNHFPLEQVQKGLKNVDIKYHEHGINAFIIDNKKVVLALSDFKKDKPEYHFMIWQDNRPIAHALSHYFEKCWQESQ